MPIIKSSIKSSNVNNFAFASVDVDATLKAARAKSSAQIIEEITTKLQKNSSLKNEEF
jgi:hypothetical protein